MQRSISSVAFCSGGSRSASSPSHPQRKSREIAPVTRSGRKASKVPSSVGASWLSVVTTGSAPSAQQLAHLIDTIKATGASAIFLETGTNPQLAQQIASETGIKVVTDLYSHSLSDARGLAPTYVDMIQSNALAIVNALK